MKPEMAVFRAPVQGGEVFACWPNRGAGLGAALTMLAKTAEHWSGWHRQQEREADLAQDAAAAEYASWFRAPAIPAPGAGHGAQP